MKIKVLSSGSKGNTTYVEAGNTKLLIDVGNSCKYICDELSKIEVDPESINGILITHTHRDHINGLMVFNKKYHKNIYVKEEMISELPDVFNYSVISDDVIQIGDIKINIIITSHDVKASMGFVFNYLDKRLVYITDTGYINKKYENILSDCDVYVLESNHDIEMLQHGKYDFNLRKRILSNKGHLSNEDSAKYLCKYIGSKTKCIMLAHLSQDNNTEELAYNTLRSKMIKNNIEFSNIIVLKQNKCSELIEV